MSVFRYLMFIVQVLIGAALVFTGDTLGQSSCLLSLTLRFYSGVLMTNDLMVDFETLGTTENSVLLSFGLCLFNRNTGDILDAVYQEFDVREQISNGLE